MFHISLINDNFIKDNATCNKSKFHKQCILGYLTPPTTKKNSVFGRDFRTDTILSEFFGRIWDSFNGAEFSSQIRLKIV